MSSVNLINNNIKGSSSERERERERREKEREDEEDLVWYKITFHFYLNNDPIGREAIEWFQTHPPSSISSSDTLSPSLSPVHHPSQSSHSSSLPSSSSSSSPSHSLSSDRIQLYSECGILSCQQEDRWYELDGIKNRARMDAHSEGTRRRLSEIVYNSLILEQKNQKLSLSILQNLLDRLISQTKRDYTLWSLLDLMAFWFMRQLQFTTCTKLSLDGSGLSERPSEISHQLLSFLCLLGNFIIPEGFILVSSSNSGSSSGSSSIVAPSYHLDERYNPINIKFVWIMKKDISNQFLTILFQKFEKNRKRNYESLFSDEKESCLEQTDIHRVNVEGELDEVEYCAWKLCSCCLNV